MYVLDLALTFTHRWKISSLLQVLDLDKIITPIVVCRLRYSLQFCELAQVKLCFFFKPAAFVVEI